MIVLGIETSCDETAVGIVDESRQILANEVFSQIEAHAMFGGVVPEIAARAHLSKLDHLIGRALDASGLEAASLNAVAATAGPGLIGGLIVGTAMAKGMAVALDIPFLAINHLEAHALTIRLLDDVEFPYLLLLVSGGHTQIVVVEGIGEYRVVGSTIDDALGEAFDKVAKMLGLGHPGGPAVETMAQNGSSEAFDLPRPLCREPGCHFSFSGLKTKVRQTILALGERASMEQTQADICASFQAAAGDILDNRLRHAILEFQRQYQGKNLVVAGGVAANIHLRQRIAATAANSDMQLHLPPLELCGDNAVMVAWAGIENLRMRGGDRLDLPARPRWPLQADT